ncbi:MAG TPA: helix-turn-helix transcriptional regulator [Myxococcota bacterium]|nr:helix-turn-helix transcriptional regulator [Myxococcota bacterium]
MASSYEKFLTGLGLALKKARIEKGYTQAEFGKKAGRNQSAIYKLENGPVPGVPLNVLYEVAQAAGLSLAELFRDAEIYADQNPAKKKLPDLLKNLENMPKSRREGVERILNEILILLPTLSDRSSNKPLTTDNLGQLS